MRRKERAQWISQGHLFIKDYQTLLSGIFKRNFKTFLANMSCKILNRDRHMLENPLRLNFHRFVAYSYQTHHFYSGKLRSEKTVSSIKILLLVLTLDLGTLPRKVMFFWAFSLATFILCCGAITQNFYNQLLVFFYKKEFFCDFHEDFQVSKS